jgi:hypothetical protein
LRREVAPRAAEERDYDSSDREQSPASQIHDVIPPGRSGELRKTNEQSGGAPETSEPKAVRRAKVKKPVPGIGRARRRDVGTERLEVGDWRRIALAVTLAVGADVVKRRQAAMLRTAIRWASVT